MTGSNAEFARPQRHTGQSSDFRDIREGVIAAEHFVSTETGERNFQARPPGSTADKPDIHTVNGWLIHIGCDGFCILGKFTGRYPLDIVITAVMACRKGCQRYFVTGRVGKFLETQSNGPGRVARNF